MPNPGCGEASGSWEKTRPGMPTNGVNLCSDRRNCTRLWRLEKFSKGYLYSTNGIPLYDHYGHITNNFVGGADIPLDANTLLSISNSLVACRRNGGTCIPRFAYTDDKWCGSEPDDFSTILTHIRQLGSVVSNFPDVVPAVECGMIGPWGEMHSSRYATSVYGRQVTSTWLEVLPPEIGLLVRAPHYIIHESEANRLRMGMFNDGYLGTDRDYGTWESRANSSGFTREQGRAYLRERNYLPYGGEFATVTTNDFDANVTLLDPAKHNIVEEWYDTHLSYLRNLHSSRLTVRQRLAEATFDPARWAFGGMPELGEYEGESLLKFCEDHMGYRYVVRGIAARRQGRRATLYLAIENTGFGRLLFPETKEILLSDGESTVTVPAQGTDFRLLEGGSNSLAEVSFELPPSMPLGTYSASLRIRVPLAGEGSSEPPRRAIAFANGGCYDAAAMANYLCKIDMDGSTDPAWWFAHFAGPQTSIGGVWSGVPGGEGAFSIAVPRRRGFDVSMEISMRAGLAARLPETLSGDTAGFAFRSGGDGTLIPYGFAGGAWHRLEGRVPEELEVFTLGIDIVRDAESGLWTVAYSADGEPLTCGGAARLTIGRAEVDPAELIFGGGGLFGSFAARQMTRTPTGIKVIVR